MIFFHGFSLIKELESRPDFDALMRTEYFEYYNGLPGTTEYVANYVKRVLVHAKENNN